MKEQIEKIVRHAASLLGGRKEVSTSPATVSAEVLETRRLQRARLEEVEARVERLLGSVGGRPGKSANGDTILLRSITLQHDGEAVQFGQINQAQPWHSRSPGWGPLSLWRETPAAAIPVEELEAAEFGRLWATLTGALETFEVEDRRRHWRDREERRLNARLAALLSGAGEVEQVALPSGATDTWCYVTVVLGGTHAQIGRLSSSELRLASEPSTHYLRLGSEWHSVDDLNHSRFERLVEAIEPTLAAAEAVAAEKEKKRREALAAHESLRANLLNEVVGDIGYTPDSHDQERVPLRALRYLRNRLRAAGTEVHKDSGTVRLRGFEVKVQGPGWRQRDVALGLWGLAADSSMPAQGQPPRFSLPALIMEAGGATLILRLADELYLWADLGQEQQLAISSFLEPALQALEKAQEQAEASRESAREDELTKALGA